MDLGSIVSETYGAYSAFQQAHPFLGSLATSQVMFPLADILSRRKIDGKSLWYTARLAPLYGAAIYGLIETGEIVGDAIRGSVDDWVVPVAQSVLGPNLWGNLFNAAFFYNTAVGKDSGYSMRALYDSYGGIARGDDGRFKNVLKNWKNKISWNGYCNSMIATFTVWEGIQWYNYGYMQDEFRTPVSLTCGLFWTVILSSWSRGKKSATDVGVAETAPVAVPDDA